MLAPLQGAQVRDDRPAISDDNVRPVRHHRVFSVRDRVENLAIRHLADPVVLERNHRGKPVLLRNPVSSSCRAVAHYACDVEALLSALHQLARYWQRNPSSPLVAHFASVEVIGAGTETDAHVRFLWRVSCDAGRRALGFRFRHFVANRNRAGDWQTRTAAVRKKIQRRLRAHFHLSHHVGEKLERRFRAFLPTKSKHGEHRDRPQHKNYEECTEHIR